MLYILNDIDKPHEDLVCAVDENARLRYLHERFADEPTHKPTDEATPLSEFGFQINALSKRYVCRQLTPSRATYRDGRPRYWQGAPEFELPRPSWAGAVDPT